MSKNIILLLALCAMPAFVTATPSFSLYDLRCEHEKNPVGIDTQHPCFSWKIYSEKRGFIQSAYQILASDTPEALDRNEGNVWSSGKVNSPQSVLTSFASVNPMTNVCV